ncbi:hypothetical protein ACTSKR_15470 [Chitinibacteraceae bacterium HSL-7]
MSDRFSLDGIAKQKEAVETAKREARSADNKLSTSRLMALANLPIAIALVIWLVAKYVL